MSSLDAPDEDLPPFLDYPSIDDFTEAKEWKESENPIPDSAENQDDSTMVSNMHCGLDTGSNIEMNSEHEPFILVGMEFKTHEEAWQLYVNYSSSKGFQPRKHTTYKSTKTGETIGRAYVCSKEGTKNICSKGIAVKRKRDKRENCKARMRVTFDQQRGIWRVTQFIDDHSHQLGSPRTSGSYRSHKFHLNPLVRKLVERLHANGISNSIIAKVINSGAVDDDQTITNQQCHDQVRKIRESNIGNECLVVIQQFQDKVKGDPMFFFAVDLDRDLTLRNVFWADGQSRISYLEFNDVVVFDVTYRTNKFLLPFAPFTGVNHHRQSILFGCALLANEKEESFTWLFRQWLTCMFNKAPGVIITDQDGQICSAIKQVFPETRHRYCSWHVTKHANEHLGLLRPNNAAFNEDYYAWFRSESISESESRWEDLKTKYDLGESNWLVTMYKKRKHWVPAYLRDVFTAGMKSSQRSESINSFFNGYVHSMTPLSEFVQQYDKALASRRKAEKDEDFATLNSKPIRESGLEWELQATSFYTRNLYDIFHKEFMSSQSYIKDKVGKDGDCTVYQVGKRDIDKAAWRTVVYDLSDGVTFTCSCVKFETEGMLCRHIMAIMRLKQVPLIPEKYFLKRWSIDARYRATGAVSSSSRESLGNEVVNPMLLFSLQSKHHQLLKEASSSMSIMKHTTPIWTTF